MAEFGMLILLAYGWWLYSKRAMGIVQLSIAPGVWVLLAAIILLTKFAVLHNPVVSGYSEAQIWDDDSWQVEYSGEDWPFSLALIAPVLGWMLLKQITELGALRTWQMRHFRNLGFVVWLGLLATSCDTGYRQVYYGRAGLPAIGSQVKH